MASFFFPSLLIRYTENFVHPLVTPCRNQLVCNNYRRPECQYLPRRPLYRANEVIRISYFPPLSLNARPISPILVLFTVIGERLLVRVQRKSLVLRLDSRYPKKKALSRARFFMFFLYFAALRVAGASNIHFLFSPYSQCI